MTDILKGSQLIFAQYTTDNLWKQTAIYLFYVELPSLAHKLDNLS